MKSIEHAAARAIEQEIQVFMLRLSKRLEDEILAAEERENTATLESKDFFRGVVAGMQSFRLKIFNELESL